MKDYEVWTEGFIDQGSEGIPTRAINHGVFKGDTFKEAVKAFKESLTDSYSIKCIDLENLTFWGCRFFDNEKDARKLYG